MLGEVVLKIREVYGVTKMYPANTTAELFCKITRTKTMTAATAKHVRELGYDVKTDRDGFVI